MRIFLHHKSKNNKKVIRDIRINGNFFNILRLTIIFYGISIFCEV